MRQSIAAIVVDEDDRLPLSAPRLLRKFRPL
jgi:hypothetical protein